MREIPEAIEGNQFCRSGWSGNREIPEANVRNKNCQSKNVTGQAGQVGQARSHTREIPEANVGNKYWQSKNVTGQAGQVGQACEKFQRPSKETNFAGQGGQVPAAKCIEPTFQLTANQCTFSVKIYTSLIHTRGKFA